MNECHIRLFASHEDFLACEELQQKVWGFAEREIVPAVELISTRKAQGVVAGAFTPQGRMDGFVFGIWALDDDGGLYHYSRMVGVRPEARGQGLARRLKLFQRDFVLARGNRLIRWTFDPLEGENASLNIAGLGVVASEYIVDFYGAKQNPVNRGLPTDRFFVRWHLASDRVCALAASPRTKPDVAALLHKLPCALSSSPLPGGDAAVHRADPSVAGREVLVEIPPSIRRLKERDLTQALRWRETVREVSQALFDRGFTVVDFATGEVQDRRRSAYLFRQEVDS